MKLWINITNDDDGIAAKPFYSKAASDAAAQAYVKAMWNDDDVLAAQEMPLDWRDAQWKISDRGGMDHVQVEEIELDLTQMFPDTTRADLCGFGDCEKDGAGNPCVWLNEYRCDGGVDEPTHDDEWNERHSCQCEDECPTCGRSVSPHTSTFCADVSPALRDLWASLPEKI